VPATWSVRTPCCQSEWRAYYDLRWRILRAPWQQPRGSERDPLESCSEHRMACDHLGNIVAVGRLHRLDDNRGQIRYMAVERGFERQGLGSLILQSLENAAIQMNMRLLVLHARESCVGFYQKRHYKLIAPSHRLFDRIQHFKMQKQLVADGMQTDTEEDSES